MKALTFLEEKKVRLSRTYEPMFFYDYLITDSVISSSSICIYNITMNK
jgi:hypothetical protein